MIGIGRVVETFLQSARVPVRAAVADIGWLIQFSAFFFFKIRTVRVAFLTEGTVFPFT